MKKLKFNFAAMAFILGSAIAFTQSSFTTVKAASSHSFATMYQFNGSALADDKDAANYSVVSGTPACSGTALPCIVSVTGDLQTWLDARTKEQIRDQATQKRN